ncbi:MAG: DUF4330 domain-containing protein [Thaumarchaeota archaeon]|nr:DUF4330 domain-containing protein [Nitrososphaerota archaeon]
MRVNPLSAGIAGLLLVLIVAGTLALVSIYRPHPSNQGTTSASDGSEPITLAAIIAGNFPTATDKNGTGGVSVTVKNLQVLYVRPQADGDWHVAVTDGTFPVFITEITPSYQSTEGMPTVGSTIDETGIAYCDTYHQAETWHGSTCWEIHPVLSWHLSA